MSPLHDPFVFVCICSFSWLFVVGIIVMKLSHKRASKCISSWGEATLYQLWYSNVWLLDLTKEEQIAIGPTWKSVFIAASSCPKRLHIARHGCDIHWGDCMILGYIAYCSGGTQRLQNVNVINASGQLAVSGQILFVYWSPGNEMNRDQWSASNQRKTIIN